jgi:hypothetical protein
MNSTIMDFAGRAKEVEEFFAFLERLDLNKDRLYIQDNGSARTLFSIDKELLKTLKATAFLLLYNVVESTMTNAIQAIYDELKYKAVSFSKVRNDLKKIVIQNLRKAEKVDEIHTKLTDISVDIITVGFNPRAVFSGNIDARLIRETAEKYGFSHATTYHTTRHGQSLLTVKTNRNDLAHGFKSFAEVGKDHSIPDLLKLKTEVIEYLKEILTNVSLYVSNQDYLQA